MLVIKDQENGVCQEFVFKVTAMNMVLILRQNAHGAIGEDARLIPENRRTSASAADAETRSVLEQKEVTQGSACTSQLYRV